MKRKLLFLMTSVLVLSCAATACGDKPSDPKTTDPVGTESVKQTESGTETEAVTEEKFPDKLPEEDLEGYIFRVYGTEPNLDIKAFYAEKEEGTLIQDAVYRKLRNVEERFNCDIKMISDGAHYSTTIQADEDAYDVVTDHELQMANMTLSFMFLNLYSVPHLDFDQPWWPKYPLEHLTVGGDQMYIFSNHISYAGMHMTRAVWFNKDLFESLDIDMPYQMVRDHKWTLDAMYEIVRQGFRELNGDGKPGPEDQYGIVFNSGFNHIMDAYGQETYVDVDGTIEYQFDTELWQRVAEKLFKVFGGEASYRAENYADNYLYFANGHALVAYSCLGDAQTLNQYGDLRYGVVPMPLVDESQTDYLSAYTERPYGIPTTAIDHLEQTGLLIEAISAEGYREVYPAYFEMAMKARYSDSSDDSEMFDIIDQNRVLSFSYVFGDSASGPHNVMLDKLFAEGSTNVASYEATVKKVQERRIKLINRAFSTMRDNGQ